MIKNLKEIYKYLDNLFKDMNKFCLECGNCCNSYCWLLKEEVENLSQFQIPVVKINNEIFCIDSFKREKKKIIFDKIPKCKLFKNGKCTMYELRPFFCRLYPLQIIKSQRGLLFVLDLACTFAKNSKKSWIEKIRENVKKFLKQTDKKLLLSILSQYYKISEITFVYRKNFIKLVEVDVNNKEILIKNV